jgi:hypothetical protein
MVVEGSMEAQVSLKGMTLYVVCDCKQDSYMG